MLEGGTAALTGHKGLLGSKHTAVVGCKPLQWDKSRLVMAGKPCTVCRARLVQPDSTKSSSLISFVATCTDTVVA